MNATSSGAVLPTAEDAIRLIRQLPTAELTDLMSALPGLSGELCPAKALIPWETGKQVWDRYRQCQDGCRRALAYIEELEERCCKAEASKAGPRKSRARSIRLALAQAIHECGHTWPEVLGIMNGLTGGDDPGPFYRDYKSLMRAKIAVSKDPAFPTWVQLAHEAIDELWAAWLDDLVGRITGREDGTARP